MVMGPSVLVEVVEAALAEIVFQVLEHKRKLVDMVYMVVVAVVAERVIHMAKKGLEEMVELDLSGLLYIA